MQCPQGDWLALLVLGLACGKTARFARTASSLCELVEPEPLVFIRELDFGVGAPGSDPGLRDETSIKKGP